MYSETFVRTCDVTPAYYYFTRNHCTNSGCSTHSDNTYTSGCNNHSNSSYHYETHSCVDHGNHGDHPQAGADHYNYSNGGSCSDGYSCSDYGYSNRHSNHYNSGYDNYNNYSNCSVKWNYGNYSDASNPNTGAPINLSWESPWISEGMKMKDSIKALENLQKNINYLIENKGRNSVTANLAGISWPHEGLVEADPKDNLTLAITSLIKNLTGKNTSIEKKEYLEDSEISAIKKATDDLASLNINYANYVNASWNPNAQGLPTEVIPQNIVIGSSIGGPYKDITEVRNS